MKISKIKQSDGAIFSKRGFTLIELMTVVTIISILSILIVPNYRQGSRQVALDMQANQFAQDLRRVQEWAMAAHKVGGVAKAGYGIYLPQGSGSYIIYLDNNGNGKYDSVVDIAQETIALDSKIEVFSCNPNPATIEYMVPNPATEINGDDGQMTQQVDFRIKGGSTIRSVISNKAGLIYVQ